MKKGIKILIVDDDEVDRMTVRRALKSAGVVVEIVEAENCASALEKLSIDQNDIAAARLSKQEQSQKPMEVENTENSLFSNQIFDCKFDCVFLDYRLPDGDALTLVQDIRDVGFKVPLIVLTGQGDEQIAVELMKAGASDYIVKGKLSSDNLSRSLYSAIRVYRAESNAFYSSQKLKESEERYRLVLEGVNDGIWDWDLTKNEVYWNDRLLEMIGLGRSQFGHTMEALYTRLHPEDKDDIIQAIEAHLEAEIDYNVQFRLLHSNGAYRYCTSQGKAQRNSQGQAVRMAGMISDITDRKRAEDALERERQQLRQIITCVPVAMAMFDTQMRYLAHSDRWLTQFNLNLPSLSTLSHYNLFPDLPDGWKMLYKQVLKGEIVSRSEDAWERADGSILILRWAAHPWYNADGEVGGMVMVTDKINELVEARETALKASLIKSQFLANMSHEIRTPMNGVLGLAQLLVRTPLETKQREWVQTIYRSAEHLLMVINDILDFSKIEAGELRLAKENFDLDNCLESVIEMVASLVEDKGIELNMVVESSVPRKLVGDSSRLKQILLNLTGNAIKFTDRGQILIYVSLKRDKQNKDSGKVDKLLFSVRDTGIGISPEGQTKLFQSFSQVDSSAAREYGGTGLGLAICKQLVDRMEGEIGVRSSLGSGSTFWFSIPLEKQLQPEPTHPELVGKKLLIVSGSALMRAAVRAFAQTWGARCDEAETAAAALTWLKSANSRMSPQLEAVENCCDVVFVDLEMPDFEAEEFVAQVRSISAIGPLIGIASLGAQPKAEALCNRGFSSYLIKPIRASRLLPALLWAVNGRGDIGSVFGTNRCDLPGVNSQFLSPTNSHSSLKILLAEDHQINQQVILAQLAVLGYQADCANNGKEALDLLAANSYDLVLMDCQMPILDGYETTQKLRQQEKGDRHTFVIALTAHAMPGEREKCLAMGMDDYLSKPVDLAALEAALNTYVIQKNLSKNDKSHENLTAIFTNPLPKQLVLAVSPEQQIAVQNWQHGDGDGLFDKQRLEQLGRVNIKLPQRILQSFVETVKVDLESAQNAAIAKDWQVVEYQAHRIKGSSANVGVTLMSDLAAQLELQARSFQSQQHNQNLILTKNDAVDNILGRLSNYLLRVQQFIESILLEGDGL